MGWWSAHVVPRVVDRALARDEVSAWRETTCRGLSGTVVELGFGSGHNVPHYPSAVDRVWAVEPSDDAWTLSAGRRASTRVVVERVGLDGARVDRPDGSADHVLSTFTLCTIPDVSGALREVARLLAPGGTFHFLEHGLSPDPGVRRWQERLDGLHAAALGGCHLTRPVTDLVSGSGLAVTRAEHLYATGPRPFGYVSLGAATRLA